MRTTKHRESGRDWDETSESAPDSVVMSQNAKGLWQPEIRLCFEPGEEEATVNRMGEIRDYLAREFRLVEPVEPPVAVKPKGETA